MQNQAKMAHFNLEEIDKLSVPSAIELQTG